jgi:purine-binding chemotaxis protein CheW
MDFLEIRKKAKERAAARTAGGAPPALPPASPGAPPEGAGAAPPLGGDLPAGEDPVVTDRDVLEGDLAARLQGLPGAEDTRFTTWRPGSGAPPITPYDPLADRSGDGPSELGAVAQVGPSGPAPEPAATPPTSLPLAPAPPLAARPPAPFDEFFYRPDEEAPELPSLGVVASPAPAAEPEHAPLEELLTFRLGAEEYAVKIDQVREVLKTPPITEVPRAPAQILGVITVRGEVVAVFDPRRRLGLPPARVSEQSGRVIIVDAGDGPCGLLVDAVASVVRLKPGTIEPCPQGIGGASADCLAGIGRERDRLFTVLDLGVLLRRAPARSGGGAGPETDAGRAHGA